MFYCTFPIDQMHVRKTNVKSVFFLFIVFQQMWTTPKLLRTNVSAQNKMNVVCVCVSDNTRVHKQMFSHMCLFRKYWCTADHNNNRSLSIKPKKQKTQLRTHIFFLSLYYFILHAHHSALSRCLPLVLPTSSRSRRSQRATRTSAPLATWIATSATT